MLRTGITADEARLTGHAEVNKPNQTNHKSVTSIGFSREAYQQLRISWYGKQLQHITKPVYLGVTLDRSLTFKDHTKTRVKVGLRNGILRKLTNTKWGVDAKTVRATALLPLQ